MFRVIVAGGRSFNNYKLLEKKLDYFFSNKKEVIIISGGAKGADTLGQQYAKLRNLPCEIYMADWDRFGKSAGYRRNEQMAEIADAAVVFWDGKSRGSQHMIDLAKKKDLPTRVVNY